MPPRSPLAWLPSCQSARDWHRCPEGTLAGFSQCPLLPPDSPSPSLPSSQVPKPGIAAQNDPRPRFTSDPRGAPRPAQALLPRGCPTGAESAPAGSLRVPNLTAARGLPVPSGAAQETPAARETPSPLALPSLLIGVSAWHRCPERPPAGLSQRPRKAPRPALGCPSLAAPPVACQPRRPPAGLVQRPPEPPALPRPGASRLQRHLLGEECGRRGRRGALGGAAAGRGTCPASRLPFLRLLRPAAPPPPPRLLPSRLAGAMASLTPQVHWAQRHPELYLRVELSDVQDPEITITDNVLHFKAQGHGAKGDNIYTFQIEFLEPVNPQPVCKVTQRQLNITVKKKESHWWERLTKQEKRPLFLAPDFDRWLDESDAELELKAKEEERINKISLKNRIPKDPFRHLKRGYLFMYNLVQFLGFSWIFVNMTVRLFMLGKESFSDTFHMSADMMYFCQTLALMEIVNTLIGLIKAPLAPVCIQIFGRNFILFVVLGSVEEMQSKAVVFFIFYIWSTIEIIRYPYYLLSSIDIEWKILTWLRYSLWMPLYPLGILAEAVAVIQAIPIFNSTGKLSFTLNYPLKVTVPFSVFLQLHLILLFLAPFILFRHMYKQRQRHLGPKKRKMH